MEDPVKTSIKILFVLAVGVALGVIGDHIVVAQQATEQRTVLLTSDLVGIAGYEVRMWRTDIGPGVAGAKHYHPGTECIYVLDGALDLEKQGEASAHLKAGDAHCVPPKTILVPRNASSTAPYKSLVVMITPKGQPLAVPVK
jgi:quercetin dioxygenase-like cupin family protein